MTIPTYNGWELLEATLPSVLAQQLDEPYEVVVVDDGSTDGTAERLRERFPVVRVVVQENAGVTRALNRCLDEGRGDVVVLLNNDVELAPGFLAAIVRELRAHPEAGSATGKMLDYRDRDVIDGAGDVIEWSGSAWRRGHGERDTGQYDAPEEVASPCGGAAAYRRAALDAVGRFDDDFVGYLEDVDWGLRALVQGWTCRYVPDAVCFHMGSATTGGDARYATLLRRNSWFLPLKSFPPRALLLHAPDIARHQVAWLLESAREGRAADHLRAWADAARLAPLMLRKRRAIQRARRVPLARLDELIVPR